MKDLSYNFLVGDSKLLTTMSKADSYLFNTENKHVNHKSIFVPCLLH